MSDPHRELLGEVVAGRRVVVALEVLVAAARMEEQLRQLGAADVLVVAGSRGTGELDPEVERQAVDLSITAEDLMDGIRAFEAALADPPRRAREAVEAFDPDGGATVIAPLFSQHERVLDRRVLGARPLAWRRLEDKTLVDALWDTAGVRRAPTVVVPPDDTALRSAAAELDRGQGTVWVADNRTGFHGGGQLLRWVRTPQDAGEATAFLADRAHRVRVMPFLDGVPCSIHGWVFDGYVAALRPCEMVVLRGVGGGRLWYAGVATTWQPRPGDREAMREAARQVGTHLREAVGYRGAFTVDGVMTAEGFRPTELNPRFGAGIGPLARETGLPAYLLHLASIERPDLDWRPVELERRILAAAEDHPVAAAGLVVPGHRVEGSQELELVRSGGGWAPTDADGEPDARLQLGPATAGAYLRVALPTHPPGQPAAPAVASVLNFTRDRWRLPLPDLHPAPDLRGSDPSRTGGSRG